MLFRSVDFVKIDQSFVADLVDDAVDTEIVRSVIRLADTMGIKALAEGVENVQQLEALRALGCPLVQGYHLARPQPAAAVEALLLRPFDVAPVDLREPASTPLQG